MRFEPQTAPRDRIRFASGGGDLLTGPEASLLARPSRLVPLSTFDIKADPAGPSCPEYSDESRRNCRPRRPQEDPQLLLTAARGARGRGEIPRRALRHGRTCVSSLVRDEAARDGLPPSGDVAPLRGPCGVAGAASLHAGAVDVSARASGGERCASDLYGVGWRSASDLYRREGGGFRPRGAARAALQARGALQPAPRGRDSLGAAPLEPFSPAPRRLVAVERDPLRTNKGTRGG